MSGSMWQGMKTRHGDGTEALSEEMESNGSATPKSRRHPLTLPADGALYRAKRRERGKFLVARGLAGPLASAKFPQTNE
jgi:hypothetical protein